MATYSTLKRGSSGNQVTTLQQFLADKGFFSDTIGTTYGPKTEAAVKAYQQSIGLDPTGIADTATWDKLAYKEATTARGVKYNAYDTTGAQADLSDIESKKPAAYVSPYQDQLSAQLSDILGRGNFSYDFASDPIYQQQVQRYQQAGKAAMQNTMGEAAALTGGYGNSYAVTAGQQAYNSYLQGANDIIPELYSQALDRYTAEGDQMYNNYNLLNTAESNAYNQYQNDLSNWGAERDYASQKAQSEQEQANWQAEFDYSTGKNRSSGGGGGSSKRSSGGGGGGSSSSGYDFSGLVYSGSLNKSWNATKTVQNIIGKYGTGDAGDKALQAAVKKGIIKESDIKRAADPNARYFGR